METRCILCHDEGTDEEELIKLHENIDHHSHLSCLNTYYGCFHSLGCPLCGKDLDAHVANLVKFNIKLDSASALNRLDLFEQRLAILTFVNYRHKKYPPRVLRWIMPKLNDDYRSYIDCRHELSAGILSSIKKNQATFSQLLLNHCVKVNIKLCLSIDYNSALYGDDQTFAKMILDTVLKNQATLAGDRLQYLNFFGRPLASVK